MSITVNDGMSLTAGRVAGNSQTFEAWLTTWADYISREQVRLRKLVEMSVTIHRRCRGLTISDQYGGWGTRSTTEGRWLDYNCDEDGDVHPINIVGQAINTQTNACLQSESNTEISSANQSARTKQIAARWQRVSDYFERLTWKEDQRNYIFDTTQKCGTVLYETYVEEEDKQSVPEVNDSKSALAVYRCESCDKTALVSAEMPESGEKFNDDEKNPQVKGEIPCPQCQQPSPAIFTPIAGYDLGMGQIDTYKIKGRIIPFYNFTIDTYNARINGIKSAKWLQIQTLWDRMEIESKYPHLNFGGADQWTYPVRVDYALATADWSYLNWWRSNRESWDFDRFEVREIYLHEDAYANYKAPADYEFINCEGEATFTIKRGQTIKEAWKSMFPDREVCGFKYIYNDNRIIDIVSPEDEQELNFRERFSDIHWMRQSGSYLSNPYYSIVDIQDQITLLNTLNMNIVARNAVNPTFYDSTIFEQADFAKEQIGTKNAAMLPENGDLRGRVIQLPVPTPSPYLQQQLTFLMEIKDGVMNTTPAMRGEAQKGAPYAAQRQQLEQSYGNLTSVLKSFAQCKNSVFLQQAKLCKQVWTLEQFQRIGSLWGDVWTEEDVAEMCQIDFDEDLVVSYRTGSEMPQGLLAKEMKFFAGLQQLMPLVSAFPQLLGQDKLTALLERVGDTMDVEFNITDIEENELIAQKRTIDLSKLCEPYKDVSVDEIDQMRNTVAGYEPYPPEQQAQVTQAAIQMAQSQPNNPQVVQQAQQMMRGIPISKLDLITEKIFHESGIRFSQYEDLNSQQQFFVNALRAEIGKVKANQMLVEVLNVMLGLVEKATVQIQQQNLEKSPEYQLQQQQLKAQQDAEAAKQQIDGAKVQNEQAKIQVDAAKVQAQQSHEAATQAEDHLHEASLQPTAKEAIIVKYESLPPKAQQQILQAQGVQVSLADLTAKQKSDAAAVKAKATAKPAAKK